jgi:hypothetical protein
MNEHKNITSSRSSADFAHRSFGADSSAVAIGFLQSDLLNPFFSFQFSVLSNVRSAAEEIEIMCSLLPNRLELKPFQSDLIVFVELIAFGYCTMNVQRNSAQKAASSRYLRYRNSSSVVAVLFSLKFHRNKD